LTPAQPAGLASTPADDRARPGSASGPGRLDRQAATRRGSRHLLPLPRPISASCPSRPVPVRTAYPSGDIRLIGDDPFRMVRWRGAGRSFGTAALNSGCPCPRCGHSRHVGCGVSSCGAAACPASAWPGRRGISSAGLSAAPPRVSRYGRWRVTDQQACAGEVVQPFIEHAGRPVVVPGLQRPRFGRLVV